MIGLHKCDNEYGFDRTFCILCLRIMYRTRCIFEEQYELAIIDKFEWSRARSLVLIYILLTKHEGRTGRISARGLDSTDLAALGPYKKDQGPIFSQDGPEQAWLIRDLLYD